MASTKPPPANESPCNQHVDSANSTNTFDSNTGWAEKVTASNSVRYIYLSLTTHLIIAIVLTLWAIVPENQTNRLSPVVIDFSTEPEKEWGETKGDDTAAQRFLASLEPLVETEDDERRFTQARELVNRAMPKGMFESILRRMASSSPQPYKRRR